MAEEFAQSLRTLCTFLVILQSALNIAPLENGMELFLERLLQPLGYSFSSYSRHIRFANAFSFPSFSLEEEIVFQGTSSGQNA